MNVKNTNNLNIKTQIGGIFLGDITLNELNFLNAFGSKGSSNKQFNEPNGLSLDYEGNLVVVDTLNHRLQIFSYRDGTLLRTIGSYGSDPGQFDHPRSVTFDGNNIIVTDGGNDRIQILQYSNGSHIRTIGNVLNYYGDYKEEELYYPLSAIVDGKGNVIVYDSSGSIKVFQISNGVYLRSISTYTGQLSGLGSIILDSEDNIIVADKANNCLQVFRYSNGNYLRTIGKKGSNNGEFHAPSSVAFDGVGNIIVADSNNNRIQILRYTDGQHLRTIGYKGNQDGEFNTPYCIVIDNEGRIIVSDTKNDRIQIFGVLYTIIKQKSIISNEAKITKNIHKSFIYSTVYNNDYTKFISTSGDSTLIIWNIEYIEHIDKKIKDITIEKILTGHKDRVVCVAWKSDNKECASGSNDCSVIIWNTVDGSIIKKYNDHDDIVRAVDYNILGTLASCSDDKTVIVYNKEKTILHHKNRVRCIKWNPFDVNVLLSGCDDFSITLWDVSNKNIIRTFKEHTNFIYSLVWKDGIKFASSSGDGSIIIWNTEEIKSTKVLTGHEGNVWSIDWKEDVLVSGGNDKKILVWDTETYEKQELIGHTRYVLAVNIDENKNIISGGTDNTINVW